MIYEWGENSNEMLSVLVSFHRLMSWLTVTRYLELLWILTVDINNKIGSLFLIEWKVSIMQYCYSIRRCNVDSQK